MTIYDDMRGYVHTHDRNGWFDVATETTPMYQMVDKADAENAKLRELVYDMLVDEERGHNDELTFDEHVERASELGVEFYA